MGSKRSGVCVAMLTIFSLFHGCNTSDSITLSRSISDADNEALVFSNGNFKLGFFSPSNSQNRYVGIWLNKVSQQTLVWVANREAPLKSRNGVFEVASDGNVAVFDKSNGRLPLWSSNVSMATATNSTSKLLASGHLVLITSNESGHSETVVWQSFDYPTDWVLPGMKFGLDRRTGLNRVLTSWKSDDDPARGEFSSRVDPHGSPQFFLYKSSAPNWRGGPWNGRTLNAVPTIASRLNLRGGLFRSS